MSTITEITTDSAFHAHLTTLPSSTLLILSFYAPWAAPCAQMSVVLSTLAQSYPITTPLKTSWLSINAEELPDISDTYDVTAVPFLVLIRGGEVLETVSGSDAVRVRTAIESCASGEVKATKKSAAAGVAPQVAVADTPVKSTTTSTTNGTAPKTAAAHQPPAPAAPTSKEDLHTRLSNLVKAAPVMLFMKGTPSAPQCGFSRQLVALLREKGVRYGFFNILADDEVRQGLKEFADWPTFPQLWVEGELVGGLDIVKEEIANDSEFLVPYQVKKETAATPVVQPEGQLA